jgi:ribosomal protein S18 acetylase RimI-like enzyme
MQVRFQQARLSPAEEALLSEGFRAHSEAQGAPDYEQRHCKWLLESDEAGISALLTASILWDWMYIDELWVSAASRRKGHGRELMRLAEAYAIAQSLRGIWLWTQSWQAEGFYRHLGYREFTRFEGFPQGHSRIGFRKTL